MLVSLIGRFGDYPPTDSEGFLAFAKELHSDLAWRIISTAEQLTPIAHHRFPTINSHERGIVVAHAATVNEPMFHRQKVAGFGTLMAECTQEMLDRWRGRAQRREVFDVAPEMMRLTLQIVGRALLSMDLTAQADVIAGNMTIANERFGEMDLSAFVPWLPTPGNARFRNAAATLRKIVLDIIAERRREGRDHGDLLSMLLAVCDEETGVGMKDEQLRDEVLTLNRSANRARDRRTEIPFAVTSGSCDRTSSTCNATTPLWG